MTPFCQALHAGRDLERLAGDVDSGSVEAHAHLLKLAVRKKARHG
jgi:hypothetical protein